LAVGTNLKLFLRYWRGAGKAGARLLRAQYPQGGTVATAWLRRSLAVLVLFLADAGFAQSQLLSEQNLVDGVLGRRTFEPVERSALDLNGDGVLDVADLAFYLLSNAHLVPSVSFETRVSKSCEGDTGIVVPIVFTKPFESPVTLTYSVSGTATPGPKNAGGDFLIAGYDATTGIGTIPLNAGATQAAIEVIVHDDALLENTESINLTLTGGSLQTYFLGSEQGHTLYLDDNDGIWTSVLELPDGPGYPSFDLEMIQEDGAFTARVLADKGLVPAPEPNDPNRSGEDGWGASVFASADGIRIEAGPIPLASTLSVLGVSYSRYFVLEVKPGTASYLFDPQRRFVGAAKQILEPVRGRLGPVWQERRYLRRESSGVFSMAKHPSPVAVEEAPLANASR